MRADNGVTVEQQHVVLPREAAAEIGGARVAEVRLVAQEPDAGPFGQWLEQSGFKIGEQVQVTIKDQEIIIKPAS